MRQSSGRKRHQSPKRIFNFKCDLTPYQYRQHAMKVIGGEEGKKKADDYQRRYYEKQSAGNEKPKAKTGKEKPKAKKGKEKPKAKKGTDVKAIEKVTSRTKFKPATKKEIEELVSKSLKKGKKKKK